MGPTSNRCPKNGCRTWLVSIQIDPTGGRTDALVSRDIGRDSCDRRPDTVDGAVSGVDRHTVLVPRTSCDA